MPELQNVASERVWPSKANVLIYAPYPSSPCLSVESHLRRSSPVSCRGTRKGSQDRNDNGYLRWTPLSLASRRPCCCWRPKVTPQLLLGSSCYCTRVCHGRLRSIQKAETYRMDSPCFQLQSPSRATLPKGQHSLRWDHTWSKKAMERRLLHPSTRARTPRACDRRVYI